MKFPSGPSPRLPFCSTRRRSVKYDDEKKTGPAKSTTGKQEEFTHEDRLKQRIQRNPKDLTGYDELGNLYLNTERYADAEEVFKQKLAASNNDPTVQEEIEDVQLRALRAKMVEGGKKAKQSGNEADKKEYERLRMTVIEKELQVYKNRCDAIRTTSSSAMNWPSDTN